MKAAGGVILVAAAFWLDGSKHAAFGVYEWVFGLPVSVSNCGGF